jgi:membrane fusion protein, copper/silver efflux system
MPVALFLIAGLGLIVALGLAQRLGWITAGEGGAAVGAAVPGAIFTCPMHPNIRQPVPGRCPICGMELVPATSSGADLDELAVTIEPAQRRLANIQTARVERGAVEQVVQTIGSIAIDESRQATIAAYIDGRLERLFADYTGVDIAQGDHLAVIYSPQLYGAQVEYLEARRRAAAAGGALAAVRQAQEQLAANTRRRMIEFGMTEEQIAELERSGEAQSRLTIYAPQGGTVVEKMAVEGMYVEAGEPIYRIADLSTVWLMLRLFPEDASRVRFGQRVDATVQSLPGETFIGRVAFIDPTVDPQTRTVGVRVELLNEDRRLRPGDYGEARIAKPIGPQGEVYDADLAGKWISPMHPQIIRDQPGDCPICGMQLVPTSRYGYAEEPVPQAESLYVPRSAVLMAGSGSVVYVETKPGRFELRPVTIGPILRDKVVVLEGLQEGDSVATAGNFLIDSQMQLAGKPSLIDPTRAIAAAKERKVPLKFDDVAVQPIPGEAGQTLERLYDAYFAVQQALAGDKRPVASDAQALNAAAAAMKDDAALPERSRELIGVVAANSEHLHHMEIEEARNSFKPISHAVVELATQARGETASASFTHFFCPMVKGGGGDWLQADDRLLNPYYGAEMLRCGDKVHQFPPRTQPQPIEAVPHEHGAAPPPAAKRG